MEYKIRAADASDIELLVRLIRLSFADAADRFGLTEHNAPRHPSNCTPAWIASEMGKAVQYYVLESRGSACGCVALEHAKPRLCYLERLGVLPESRGEGFGTALVNHVLETCRTLGAEIVQIGIISADTRLRLWYEELGFQETHTATYAHLPFEVAFLSNVLNKKTRSIVQKPPRIEEESCRRSKYR